ncbi:MAG: ATP-binding cassette domain-containing protein [Candidatus Flemingibacterium sp.]|nr:ATP-binding cassette domain-containing protein [Candidatus Flemingibacterium sp.]
MTENKTILSVKDLRFTYSGQEKPALDGVTLEVRRGDFLALFGRSGSGKSTLLRCLKPSLTPAGKMGGEILFDGEPITRMPHHDETAKIGFLLQDPENQIVTDKVWHELAFGPESLGIPTDEIRRRVAETASFFGIGGWFHSDTSALSGGQKQLLSLAALMVMRPEILILDEPTSRLDPIAANELFSALVRVNRELGTTVIMTEHRLDEALSAATMAVVIDDGKILAEGTPADVARKIADGDIGSGTRALRAALPAYMRIGEGSVRAARELVGGLASENRLFTLPEKKERARGDVVLSAENISFAYGDRQVVRDLTLEIRRGEINALVGGNGSGKTTTLRLLAGLIQPQCGFVTKKARTAILPQEPRSLFTKNTLRDELADISGDEKKLAEAINICGLGGLLDRHPYDLSGGETQRAGIAMLLLTGADILLLDEPTKGTDAGFRDEFGRLLGRLADEGKAILIVSHDLEFCAETADRCAMLFDGGIVSEGAPREFFGNSEYYTTTACRIAHGYSPAVTSDELVFACRGESPEEDTDSLPEDTLERTVETSTGHFNEKPKMSIPRKIITVISAVISIVIVFFAVKQTDLGSVLDGGTTGQLISAASLAVSLTVLAFALGGGRDRFAAVPARRHSKKSLVLAGILIALILPTLILGGMFLDDRKYYFISLAVLVEVMAAFFILFEGRRPKSREIAVMAVICALGIAGRAAFFMLPQFKPVAALVIIAGMTLGGGSGFIVGAVTMLVSNMLFSQGPWTPWQMFAMGLVGLIAGGLSGFLRGGKGRLCVFGALVTIVVYGGLMNLSSALIWAREPDIGVILTYFVTGFPMDCVHAAATALFLWFGAEPMCEKLDRLRVRYGLFE